MVKAKELFEVYCAICHGNEGNGKGKLVTQEKILGVPSYADREISVGSVFHVQAYGLNSMGAYSNQMTQKERWMVSEYVMELKSKL
jgi:mono/diheme cytochrome c family protein